MSNIAALLRHKFLSVWSGKITGLQAKLFPPKTGIRFVCGRVCSWHPQEWQLGIIVTIRNYRFGFMLLEP